MKFKKLAWLLLCMPIGAFAQTGLQLATDQNNATTNQLFITGKGKAPASGLGLMIGHDDATAESFLFSKNLNTGANLPLILRGANIGFNTDQTVRFTANTRGSLFVFDEQAGGRSLMILDANGGDALGMDYFAISHYAGLQGVEIGTFNAAPMKFLTGNTRRMTITADGFVGINTESPTPGYIMDVNGPSYIRGTLRSGGFLESSIPGKWVDAAGNTQDNGIGGALRLIDPTKTQPGEAKEWVLYNMSGVYGNSLQFWNYDNLGCAAGGMCQARMVLMDDGKVGINTPRPTEQLSVNGTILARRIRVSTNAADWPDYVFADNYQLPSLQSVEAFIREHKHLPEIPSAATIEETGQDLGEMQKLQMQKIEELTLYIIQQNKLIEAQNKRIEIMEAQLAELKKH